MNAGCPYLASGEVELYFYDELDPAARRAAALHLRTCQDCRLALDDLAVIREALGRSETVMTPPGGDWTPFMSRLAGRLPAPVPAPVARPRGPGRTVTYLAMAALLMLVTASVAMLSRLDPADPVRQATAGEVSTVPVAVPAESPRPAAATRRRGGPAIADTAFTTLSEQHFARSKLVVLGLATKSAGAGERDWRYERELASTLLPETRLYRRAAQDRGMTALAGVMSDLEIVLLQASLSDDRDAGTLPQLQRLIRRRDLVTKIQVVEAGF